MANAHSRIMRELNERIFAMQRQELYLQDADYAAFVCECDDEACTESVRLTLGEYAAHRHTQQVVAPGQGAGG